MRESLREAPGEEDDELVLIAVVITSEPFSSTLFAATILDATDTVRVSVSAEGHILRPTSSSMLLLF